MVLRIVLTEPLFPVTDVDTTPGCRRSSASRPAELTTAAATQTRGTNQSAERSHDRKRNRRMPPPYPESVVAMPRGIPG
jgi:hypothetical protein